MNLTCCINVRYTAVFKQHLYCFSKSISQFWFACSIVFISNFEKHALSSWSCRFQKTLDQTWKLILLINPRSSGGLWLAQMCGMLWKWLKMDNWSQLQITLTKNLTELLSSCITTITCCENKIVWGWVVDLKHYKDITVWSGMQWWKTCLSALNYKCCLFWSRAISLWFRLRCSLSESLSLVCVVKFNKSCSYFQGKKTLSVTVMGIIIFTLIKSAKNKRVQSLGRKKTQLYLIQKEKKVSWVFSIIATF